MTAYAIVSTTVANETEAKTLAQKLVSTKLAACVQILPIESVYEWNGAIETASEHLLLCKILAAEFTAVSEAIRADHTYEVPEIVMTPIAAGAPSYLDWLSRQTQR